MCQKSYPKLSFTESLQAKLYLYMLRCRQVQLIIASKKLYCSHETEHNRQRERQGTRVEQNVTCDEKA